MNLKFLIDKEYDIEMSRAFEFSKDKIDYLKLCYRKSIKYLEKTVDWYQISWDEINDEFSNYISIETGYDWYYPQHECVVSFIHGGISNWGTSPKIVRVWNENPYSMRKITAHELILSHYFEIVKRNFKEESLTDEQIWALAEIAAFSLTSLTEKVKIFWPWNTFYNTNHNYPHIVDMQNSLKDAFLKRNNFDEYINKGITLIKKFPNINTTGI